jgi:ribosomal protein L12E/L44/L45/RPP1/RPP2
MNGRLLWSFARLVVIAVALSGMVVGYGVVAPGAGASVAEASPALDKKDEKDSKRDKKAKQKDDDRGEDFVLNGQVLEMDVRKDPPELIVGTVDGRARVRVLKTDEIDRNGVLVGDYVELTGEKINELLFEATEISVHKRGDGAVEASSAPGEPEPSDESEEDASEDEEASD